MITKTKEISFKQFASDYRNYYNLKNVYIRDSREAEDVIYDLYDTDLFEFDYDRKVIEIYYN